MATAMVTCYARAWNGALPEYAQNSGIGTSSCDLQNAGGYSMANGSAYVLGNFNFHASVEGRSIGFQPTGFGSRMAPAAEFGARPAEWSDLALDRIYFDAAPQSIPAFQFSQPVDEHGKLNDRAAGPNVQTPEPSTGLLVISCAAALLLAGFFAKVKTHRSTRA